MSLSVTDKQVLDALIAKLLRQFGYRENAIANSVADAISAGGGNVTSSGTPVAGEIPLFTSDSDISSSGITDNGTLIDLTSRSLKLATTKTLTVGSTVLIQDDKLQASALSITSQAAGDILYASSASAWERLAKGTDGQVLTLASGVPSWADAAGGLSSIGGDATTPGLPTASAAGTGFFDGTSDSIGVSLDGAEGFRFLRISASECGIAAPAGGYLYGQSNNGLNYWRATNGELLFVGGNGAAGLRMDSTGNRFTSDIYPSGDADNGTTIAPWRYSYTKRHNLVHQTVSFSATPAFDTASGSSIAIVLTDDITSWTVTNGETGFSQLLHITWKQDGSGSHTVGGTPANVVFASAWTMTATADKSDSFTFRWDALNSVWVEVGRTVNY